MTLPESVKEKLLIDYYEEFFTRLSNHDHPDC
jgi:hypothetical protein